ncbi:cobalamin biosynthesis protein [Jhaorihella thermophila]|uniref:Cobalt-precorrin 5A hydrolase n=1 Tax=Jhaorihella thermophila TaxID=488547 RepID=A0A1H5YTM8_9RHOB|nr:cobalamin biosynthesis protein [Jhaorihella thermophila]SEG27180.1 cobalt-precorrin 5A hydrolase [Jhaorihella thermophila]
MIVAGIGFRASASADSLRSALDRAAQGRAPDLIAAPADKAAAPCLTAFAARLGVPVQAVPADRLAAMETPTQSARVHASRGTGSVAEAAALAAAGPGARLLTPRQISEDRQATCAAAISGETQ